MSSNGCPSMLHSVDETCPSTKLGADFCRLELPSTRRRAAYEGSVDLPVCMSPPSHSEFALIYNIGGVIISSSTVTVDVDYDSLNHP